MTLLGNTLGRPQVYYNKLLIPSKKFVNILLIDYNLIILNASKIIVCDSCFSAIVIPYKIKGEIKTDDISIYCRNNWSYEALTDKVKFIY